MAEVNDHRAFYHLRSWSFTNDLISIIPCITTLFPVSSWIVYLKAMFCYSLLLVNWCFSPGQDTLEFKPSDRDPNTVQNSSDDTQARKKKNLSVCLVCKGEMDCTTLFVYFSLSAVPPYHVVYKNVRHPKVLRDVQWLLQVRSVICV